MKGQKIAIRIISGEYLKIQKIYKYKYEVMSKGSLYFEYVDIIFSNFVLRGAHTFVVTFNKDNNYPKISKVIKDITREKTRTVT